MSRTEFVQQSWFFYPVAIGVGIAIMAGLVDVDVGLMTAGGVATAAAVVAAVGPETDRWRAKVQNDQDRAKLVEAVTRSYQTFTAAAAASWPYGQDLKTGDKWHNLQRDLEISNPSSYFDKSRWSNDLLVEPWRHYDELVSVLCGVAQEDVKKRTVLANALTEYGVKMLRTSMLLQERGEYIALEQQLWSMRDNDPGRATIQAKLELHDDVPPELVQARLMELYEAYRTIKKAAQTMSLPTYDHDSVLQDLAAMSATDKTEDLLTRFAAKNEAKIKAARRQNA